MGGAVGGAMGGAMGGALYSASSGGAPYNGRINDDTAAS